MNQVAPKSTSAYAVRAGDAVRDRGKVLSTWRGNLGDDARHVTKFDWFYLHCPWGQPLLQLLTQGTSDACLGTAAAGPRRMYWRHREILAGILVDVTVTAKHRSLGPALMLQSALMKAAEGHFDLLYGFPNTKAIAMAKRSGYTVVGHIARFCCVLKYSSYLRRFMPAILARPLGWMLDVVRGFQAALHIGRGPLTADWQDRADSRIDQLWTSSEHPAGLIAARDTALLQWRFDQLQGVATRYLYVCECDNGPLVAWFACQTEGAILHVRDFWSRDAARGVSRPLIAMLTRAARRDGHTVVFVEYAAPPERLAGWLAAGFVERERRPIVARWIDAGAGEQAPTDFHLTAADEDE